MILFALALTSAAQAGVKIDIVFVMAIMPIDEGMGWSSTMTSCPENEGYTREV